MAHVMRRTGLPEFKSAVRNSFVDDEEQIWVQRNAPEKESTATCLILDTSGNLTTSLKLPANLRIEIIRSEKAHGVLRAEDGANLLAACDILQIARTTGISARRMGIQKNRQTFSTTCAGMSQDWAEHAPCDPASCAGNSNSRDWQAPQ